MPPSHVSVTNRERVINTADQPGTWGYLDGVLSSWCQSHPALVTVGTWQGESAECYLISTSKSFPSHPPILSFNFPPVVISIEVHFEVLFLNAIIIPINYNFVQRLKNYFLFGFQLSLQMMANVLLTSLVGGYTGYLALAERI